MSLLLLGGKALLPLEAGRALLPLAGDRQAVGRPERCMLGGRAALGREYRRLGACLYTPVGLAVWGRGQPQAEPGTEDCAQGLRRADILGC